MAEDIEEEKPDQGTENEEAELDEDMAEALLDVGSPSDGNEEAVDVDEAIAEIDPNFKDELGTISKEDFSGVVIEKDKVSAEVDENAKVPSAFRSFINNLPQELKNRFQIAAIVAVVATILVILILKGMILPTFELPYQKSMDELSKDVFTYPTEGTKVPLFDEFRTDAHTVELPKTVINLKPANGRNSYGEFTFSLVLRDKDLSTAIEAKQSEIIDLIQRVLEQVTYKELQNPRGKERVKKVVRHRLNEYLQGNVILAVYYREVILEK